MRGGERDGGRGGLGQPEGKRRRMERGKAGGVSADAVPISYHAITYRYGCYYNIETKPRHAFPPPAIKASMLGVSEYRSTHVFLLGVKHVTMDHRKNKTVPHHAILYRTIPYHIQYEPNHTIPSHTPGNISCCTINHMIPYHTIDQSTPWHTFPYHTTKYTIHRNIPRDTSFHTLQ